MFLQIKNITKSPFAYSQGQETSAENILVNLSSATSQWRRLDTDTFPVKDIKHQLRWPVIPIDLFVVFKDLDVFNVLVKEISTVRRPALGFRMELGREDWTSLMRHT